MEDHLNAYFAIRRQQRDDEIRRTWEALSPHAQRIFRDAAVMGYVCGTRAGQDRIPSDPDIVTEVLGAAIAMPDLYPTVQRARRRGERLARRGDESGAEQV
jgi:hypothetical protein